MTLHGSDSTMKFIFQIVESILKVKLPYGHCLFVPNKISIDIRN